MSPARDCCCKNASNNVNPIDFQTHVHEYLGSTGLAAPPNSPQLLHNHRFAGVTGPEIERPCGHVHILSGNSDFFFNHYHQIEVETGPPILVRDQNGEVIGHIHGFSSVSSIDFFHAHAFKGSTLIENPIFM